MDILDTAGHEEYGVLQDQAIEAREGFILTYSMSSRESYNIARRLYAKIQESKLLKAKGYAITLVRYKCDMVEEREVSIEEGRHLAHQLSCTFYETSAKNSVKVGESFTDVIRGLRQLKDKLIVIEQNGPKPEEELRAITNEGSPNRYSARHHFKISWRSLKIPVRGRRQLNRQIQEHMNFYPSFKDILSY